jgi:hypothetical protein
MTRPPSWKKAPRTRAHESRAATSSPTLNVIQLPSPTTGSASPLDGIGRVRIGPGRVAGDRDRRAEAAPAAARDESRVRRVSLEGGVIGSLVSALGTRRDRRLIPPCSRCRQGEVGSGPAPASRARRVQFGGHRVSPGRGADVPRAALDPGARAFSPPPEESRWSSVDVFPSRVIREARPNPGPRGIRQPGDFSTVSSHVPRRPDPVDPSPTLSTEERWRRRGAEARTSGSGMRSC